MSRIFNVKVNGKSYEVEVEEINSNQESTTEVAQPKPQPKNESPKPEPKKEEKKPEPKNEPSPEPAATSQGGKEILAPLPGVVIDVKVKVGDKVNTGDKVMVIEAMKMENEIPSEFTGIVDKILVNKGDNVDGDEPVILLK